MRLAIVAILAASFAVLLLYGAMRTAERIAQQRIEVTP